MATTDTIVLDVERVRELLESQYRFLTVLQELVEGKITEEHRGELTLVKGGDDG